MSKSRKRVNGYSLVELLVATVLFTIVAGTVFSLLLSAQLRYRGESDVTTAFQQANMCIPPDPRRPIPLRGHLRYHRTPVQWQSRFPGL